MREGRVNWNYCNKESKMSRPITTTVGLKKSLPTDPERVSGVDEHSGPIMDANLDAIDAAIAALQSALGGAGSGAYTVNVTITKSSPVFTFDGAAGTASGGAVVFRNAGVQKFAIYKANGNDTLTIDDATATVVQIFTGGQVDFVGGSTSDSKRVSGGIFQAKADATSTSTGANCVSYGGFTQATVGGAGGASALPATPRGYIIINVAGTARVVPFYDQV